MNAGLKGYTIFDKLLYIRTFKGLISKDNINFKYRTTDIKDIIFEAIFKIDIEFNRNLWKDLIKIRVNQPKEPSLGSCFKNPKDNFAGKLLEDVGLKGYRINDISFSQKHSNFLVNLGKASCDDVKKIIDIAQEKVLKEFNIELHKEIILL